MMHHTYDCLHIVSFPHLDVTKQATQHDAELKLEHAQQQIKQVSVGGHACRL